MHSMQSDDNSDLSIHHDGFLDTNCAVDNNDRLTDVVFPVISSVDYTTDADKAPSFLSALFAHVNALLGIRHVTSASRTARSNGQAEALVKRLSTSNSMPRMTTL